MWRNFFNVALRNISKNRIFSFINIFGLAIGLASAILIILFISREISFDRFNEKSERIFRAYVDVNVGGQKFRGALTSFPMAPVVTAEIDDIVDFVRLDVYLQQLVWHDDVKLIEDNVIFADSSFFDIFSIELLYGDPKTVLNAPETVVITKSKAIQYFGTVNPLGEVLEFNIDGNEYLVTGVMEDFPENSHFFCDFLMSMNGTEASRNEDWLSNSIYSYLLLNKKADYKKVEQQMNEVMGEYVRLQLMAILGLTTEEWEQGGNVFDIYLQPITDIHLNPDIEYGSESCIRPVNDKKYIHIFALIAFFILVIASINFMNLSTARSAIRSREIAMRKVVGSSRKVLIWQFLVESVILSLLSLILALFLVEISMPLFNRAMGLNLNFESIGQGGVFIGVFLLAVLIGLMSGLYPAFYISSYEPLIGLRGGSLRGRRSAIFRRMMVIFQFTISVAIIVGTLVVSNQVNYLFEKDPGFKDESIVVLDRIYPLESRIDVFCEMVEKIPGVAKATNSSTYLGFSNLSSSYQVKGADRSKNFMMDVNYVDVDFLETYGLKLLDDGGRFFSSRKQSDTMAVVLNAAAVREYDFTSPLNTYIQTPTSSGDIVNYKVIGVVEDFHHSTLRKSITPYMFMYKTESNSQSGYISIRFEKSNIYNGNTLKKINQVWDKVTNDEPFQYFFLDDELHRYYREEERTGKISLLFAILAIIIACLGLLGLTIFNTERRIREIAIRKAMGANLWDLLMIISKEILGMLGVSILLAWILAYLFMHNWLQVFPYNIGFTPGIYIVAAIAAILIAMITVNSITLRAAHRNPVDALYHE